MLLFLANESIFSNAEVWVSAVAGVGTTPTVWPCFNFCGETFGWTTSGLCSIIIFVLNSLDDEKVGVAWQSLQKIKKQKLLSFGNDS